MRDPIARARRVLSAGQWTLIGGLIFYSLMTTTPFVADHSQWSWSGAVLGLIVDVAFIMALSAETTLASLGVSAAGAWPKAFRWLTGLSSVFLNTWVSIESEDPVGVAVHLIAPALVMLLAEVGPIYLAALRKAELLTASQEVVIPVAVPAAQLEIEIPRQPAAENEPSPEVPRERLSKARARAVIESGYKANRPVADVAAAATRHPATVARVYKELAASMV